MLCARDHFNPLAQVRVQVNCDALSRSCCPMHGAGGAGRLHGATHSPEAADTFPLSNSRPGERPGFITWACDKTNPSKSQIYSLMNVYAKFGVHSGGGRLSHHVMKVLSSESVPEAARQEAIERSTRGEAVANSSVPQKPAHAFDHQAAIPHAPRV